MKITDAIRFVMKETKTNQTQLAERVGAKGQSVIAQRLRTSNLSIDVVVDMLDTMGYELIVQEKKRGRRTEGQMPIERSEAK